MTTKGGREVGQGDRAPKACPLDECRAHNRRYVKLRQHLSNTHHLLKAEVDEVMRQVPRAPIARRRQPPTTTQPPPPPTTETTPEEKEEEPAPSTPTAATMQAVTAAMQSDVEPDDECLPSPPPLQKLTRRQQEDAEWRRDIHRSYASLETRPPSPLGLQVSCPFDQSPKKPPPTPPVTVSSPSVVKLPSPSSSYSSLMRIRRICSKASFSQTLEI